MGEADIARLFSELVSRRLISNGHGATASGGGNRDRRDARRAWVVSAPDGTRLRLLTGTGVIARGERQRVFSTHAPELVLPPTFAGPVGAHEVVAEAHLSGRTLENIIVQEGATSAVRHLARAQASLARIIEPSKETERTDEWSRIADAIAESLFWDARSADLLRAAILPALRLALCTRPPERRWTNGDFTAENLLVEDSGNVRLIDHEFASCTHFFEEDWVRFHVLSPAVRANSAVFSDLVPLRGPAWHLFFWLRQSSLEAISNTAAYLDAIRPQRLQLIRSLAEHLLQKPLSGWPAPARPLDLNVEVARWTLELHSDLRVSGWVHAPDDSPHGVVAFQGAGAIGKSPLRERRDVQSHFKGAASARETGFDLALAVPDPDLPIEICALGAEGRMVPMRIIHGRALPGLGPRLTDFASWARRFDPDPPSAPSLHPCAFFSVLLPVFRTPPAFLEACIASVRKQYHQHWELCVVDDGSGDPAIVEILRRSSAADRRIRIHVLDRNIGIANATNLALEMAAAEFCVFLDHDDLLRPHALAEFAAVLQRSPDTDVLYSDEDKIDESGNRVLGFLKPDFSPEFLRGVMYIGHALCVRTALARSTGGFDSTFNGVQDFEFMLRLSERTKRIVHVPRMLYHWRRSAGSSAMHGNVKGDMDERQRLAVQAHLDRIGDSRTARALGGHRVALESDQRVDFVRIGLDGPCRAPADLLSTARRSSGQVIVAGESALAIMGSHELASLAALEDSGFVAPVVISTDGRVVDAGLATASGHCVPIMRGFDADGDGYNGTLRCNREVAAVSSRVFAVRSTLLLRVPPIESETWFTYLQRLAESGVYHRVCANSRAVVSTAWNDTAMSGGPSPPSDRYFNPHFDPAAADYRFVRRIRHFAPPVQWHLETPVGTSVPDGNLLFRGWAFRNDALPLQLTVEVAGMEWTSSCHLPRPDVQLAFSGFTDGKCGFAIRLRAPAGSHVVCFVFRTDGEIVARFRIGVVTVPRSATLNRWLFAASARRLAFQLLAAPSYPPRPVIPENFPARRHRERPLPALSIVTPSFQQARFLEQTIRSVVEQNADVQYVVQDGGSRDGSVEIIQRYAPRLTAWESAPDQGQSDAIVRGFAKTSGADEDIMAWLNSDDYYLPGALRFVREFFAQHPEVDAVYGHRVVVDEDSREVGRWFLPPHDSDVLRLNDFVPQETLFWRRRAWNRAGPVDSAYSFAMDWDFLLRLEESGARIVRVPFFLGCFRIHSRQKTSAMIHDAGEREIRQLRTLANSRTIAPEDLENDPVLTRYLRASARAELLWSLGICTR